MLTQIVAGRVTVTFPRMDVARVNMFIPQCERVPDCDVSMMYTLGGVLLRTSPEDIPRGKGRKVLEMRAERAVKQLREGA